ncbi:MULTISPECIES: hypothetical protein [Pseudomonas]|uniref:Secreted protein n=1 Tax=Pseudomonas eucalypticola TaxID=2599595 RepID=A0A7D5D7R4_9PSED|nr:MULTISPECIES: hypothetical protein [Pseudomonas]QKZ04958.1 hypothetical protein HWQ56_14650 [Pseudomonas eucalypticola]
MKQLILPVMGTVLLCAQSFVACAADSTSAASTSSMQEVRQQIEAKRDQISGVDRVQTATQTATSVDDAPIVTDDAPAQEQQQ